MANKKVKKASPFWRILISLVGAALILIAMLELLLFIFGETTAADMNVRRQAGSNDGAPSNQRYEWSIDYTFYDQAGKQHQGHTTRRGSDTSVKSDDTVYYFTFAPFISALESDAKPGLSQCLYIVIGILLLIIMNKKKNAKTRKSTAAMKRMCPEDLMDYDDSIEEQFHDR